MKFDIVQKVYLLMCPTDQDGDLIAEAIDREGLVGDRLSKRTFLATFVDTPQDIHARILAKYNVARLHWSRLGDAEETRIPNKAR